MRRHGLACVVLLLSLSGGALAQNPPAVQPQNPPPLPAAPPALPAAAPAAPAAPGSEGHPADDDAQKIKLPNVNVQGKRNVFNDNDKHIKDLQEALPCTGCDAKPRTKRKFVKRVLDAVGDRVLPSEAPDHTDRDANDRAKEFSQENTCTAANVSGCVPDNLKP
ncbi:MAG: hypothetical protein JOY51_07820 [Nevskia sp.]|nr:hypothetical protein [Nevskia sp.]